MSESMIIDEVEQAESGEEAQSPREMSAAPASSGGRASAPLAGAVINSANHHPVSGVRVKAYFRASSDRGGAEFLLGQATTGGDGRFSLRFEETAKVHQCLDLLRQGHGAICVLKVEGATGGLLFTSKPISVTSHTPVTLSIQLATRGVTASLWAEVGRRLEEGRVSRLHELARQLGGVRAEQSLFGDWDVETRHALLAELEQAFLDPRGVLRAIAPLPSFATLHKQAARANYEMVIANSLEVADVGTAWAELSGKVECFASLYDVDWVIDISEFSNGQPGPAITKYQGEYVEVGVTNIEYYQGDRVKYRNYLRAIYTGGTDAQHYQSHKQKLEQRFHQDFATVDDWQQPANKVLIPILKTILTAPKGNGYGFAISNADIPSQGEKTYREYLDELIALTGHSARELGLRYRLNLERPDSALSSPVSENIATLQGFYRDWFHSVTDPYPVLQIGQVKYAPFFMQYDEWARFNEVTYAENSYQIMTDFSTGVDPSAREHAKTKNEWIAALIELEKMMSHGQQQFALGQYPTARETYLAAVEMAYAAMDYYLKQSAWVSSDKLKDSAQGEIALLPIESYYAPAHVNDYDNFDTWFSSERWQLRLRLIHLIAYVLPVCQGDIAFAMGDYPAAAKHYAAATRFRVSRADLGAPAYDPTSNSPAGLEIPVINMNDECAHLDGSLPYSFDPTMFFNTTATITEQEENDPLWRLFEMTSWSDGGYYADIAGELRTQTLKQFCKLRHGNALLEWADALYRTDDPASIARARELYKAVLSLHGALVPVSPNWTNFTYVPYVNQNENPALKSQKARARRGFAQIEMDLNYYGVHRDFVPALRYRALKDAADRCAATAKAAQQDFLAYLGRVEDAIRDGLVTTNMLKKATLQIKIADQQVKVAESGVMLAEHQVEQVEAAIEAKKAEIKDHNSGWTALGDWVGGMVGAITDLPSFLTDDVKKDAPGIVSADLGISTGTAAGGGAATSALGATGTMLGAVGLYVYGGVVSIKAMEKAHDQRSAELITLRNDALPLAESNLEARQAEAVIADLLTQIAQADADLAAELIKFQVSRILNIEFWADVTKVVKRIMRRYLEMGARFAWLAERALEYEQDRELNIVRFDYYPAKLQGVTGADLLKLDLDELEAARLDGIKVTLPIKHTYSMMADFPLQFAQLKKKGRCTFQTTELPLQLAYPGTYGYRVVAVSVGIKGLTSAAPVRGLLRNHGVSLLSRANGERHTSVRYPDAFPLSEFRLREDMAVYSLPDEALMSFEGSGVESFWELSFPTAANPYGLDEIADIQLTLDVRASYSPSLYEQHLADVPTSVNRFMIFSAQKLSPAGLAALQDDGQNSPSTTELVFDLAEAGLPMKESNRVVKNLIIFFASETPPSLSASFGPQGGSAVVVPFNQGMALSSGPPWDNSQSPAPATMLNQFIGSQVDQSWVLTIDKNLAPGVDFTKVVDVALGVEYKASLI